MRMLLGKETMSDELVFLNAEGSRAMLVCGKRGSGKSYTLGVLVEELVAVGGDAVIPIIVDPMGVYHTMSQGNIHEQDTLYKWGLSPKSYEVRLLIPGVPETFYGPDILDALAKRGVNVVRLQLNPSDLSSDGWCDLFGADINRPLGIVLDRAVQKLTDGITPFTIQDIIRAIERDGRAPDPTREALTNRLHAAIGWQIFASDGYRPLEQLFVPGAINVLDLSQLEPGNRGRRNLTVSVIARNLFRGRSDARLREEFGLATGLPRIWMLIDEAHQFVPSGAKTLSKEQLVRWAKEGRQPGLSLVVASQQPSAIDPEILSQCDIILSHKLTSKADVSALNSLSQDYMGSELRTLIGALQRTGEAVLVDDERETVNMLSIRPRRSHHGGSTRPPKEVEILDIWNQ